MTTFTTFDDVLRRMAAIHQAKNADYGDSYELSARLLGRPVVEGLLHRMSDKLARACRLAQGHEPQVKAEALADTLLDLSIYSILALLSLENQEGHGIQRSLRPGLATTAGLLIGISSAYSKSGIMWEAHKRYFGQDGDVLVWIAPSRTMNPSLSESVINRALEEDRISAECEYFCRWREDVSGFLDYETIETLVVPGRRELPPQDGIRYFGFGDPSGGRADSFTLALAHREGDQIILDLLRRQTPPFNPGEVVAEFCQVLKEYRCTEISGDKYAAEWVTSSFRAHGITYKNSERDRSQIFQEAVPLFTRGQAILLDHKVLISELSGLERQVRPLGKEMIAHGPGGHDDVANAACGALVLAGGVRHMRCAGLFEFYRQEAEKLKQAEQAS